MVSIDSISSAIATKDSDVPEQAETPEDKLAKKVEAKKAEAKTKSAKASNANADSTKQAKDSAAKAGTKSSAKSTEFDELLTQTQVKNETGATSQDQTNAQKIAQTKDGTALKTDKSTDKNSDAKKNAHHATNSSLVRKKNVTQDALVEMAAAGLAASASQQMTGTATVPTLKNIESTQLQDKLIQKNPKVPMSPQIQGPTGPANVNGTQSIPQEMLTNPQGLNPQQAYQPIIVNLPPPVIMAIPVEMNESDLVSVDSIDRDHSDMASHLPTAFGGIATEDYMHGHNQLLSRNHNLNTIQSMNQNLNSHGSMKDSNSFGSDLSGGSQQPLWLSDPYANQNIMYPQVLMAGLGGVAVAPQVYSQGVSNVSELAAGIQNQKVDITNPAAVSGQILGLSNRGGGEVKIKIHPQELGELTIRVSNDKGKLNVKMESSSREAQEILKSSLPELRDHLTSSKYDVAHIEVSGASIHTHKISNLDSMVRANSLNPMEFADLNRSQGRDSNSDSGSYNQNRYSQPNREDQYNNPQGRGNGYKRYYEQYADV